jgi:D-glycerate 3-kinase
MTEIVSLVAKQIVSWLPIRKSGKPLFVCINGPQGSGKTTLVNNLIKQLTCAPSNLTVASFSLDDVYLTFLQQSKLATSKNPLIEYRGNPGTHDLQLCFNTLNKLEANRGTVLIPSYDKSMQCGRGDRCPVEKWHTTTAPWDVVLFEGWCNGFAPPTNLEEMLEKSTYAKQFDKQHVQQVLKKLVDYQELWKRFDVCIHLNAQDIKYTFDWRWQQEQAMKAAGKQGLTHEQVTDFVKRFMPLNDLSLPGFIQHGMFAGRKDMQGRHFRITIDFDRNVVSSVLI